MVGNIKREILSRSFVFFESIPTDIKNFGLQVDVEKILGGDEIGSRSWVFQSYVLLVGLLFGEDLYLFGHFLVQLKQLLKFCFFLPQLFLKITVSVGFQPERGFMIAFDIFEGIGERSFHSIFLVEDCFVILLVFFDHFITKVIDVGLKFAFSFAGSLQSFSHVLDFSFFHGDIILEDLIFLLNHSVFGGEGFSFVSKLIGSATELSLQLIDQSFVIRFFLLGRVSNFIELMTNIGCLFLQSLLLLFVKHLVV